MSRVMSSPPIFKENSSGSITSSVQSEHSEMSIDAKQEIQPGVKISKLFEQLADEKLKIRNNLVLKINWLIS